jgi:hypothetical protein
MEQFAVRVSKLLPVVGFALKDGVRPLGKLGTLKVTLPVNPACGAIVMLPDAEAPWATVKEVGELLKVKLGGKPTVR